MHRETRADPPSQAARKSAGSMATIKRRNTWRIIEWGLNRSASYSLCFMSIQLAMKFR
jgi:hypothetical protein